MADKFLLVSSIFYEKNQILFIEIKHAKWLGQYLHNSNVYILLTHYDGFFKRNSRTQNSYVTVRREKVQIEMCVGG